MISPSYLKQGDRVAIVATAKAIDREGVELARLEFESWGLEVVFGAHLFDRYHQFSGPDLDRLRDFQEALDDPSIKAIICARGGYGTTRILDQIDFSTFEKHPKWVCGFSDITALISKINNLGIEAMHSTMPVFFNLGLTRASKDSLKHALFGNSLHYTIPTSTLNKNGFAEGLLVGGNLSMLCSSMGTDSETDTFGKILFLEDLTEYLYHIDRMMGQLDRSGKLIDLRGLIVGHFSKMQDNEIPFGKSVQEIILDHCSTYNFPIIFDFPVGHEPENRTLICGRLTTMATDLNRTEVIQNPAVLA